MQSKVSDSVFSRQLCLKKKILKTEALVPDVMNPDLDGPEPKQYNLTDRRQPHHKGVEKGDLDNRSIFFLSLLLIDTNPLFI